MLRLSAAAFRGRIPFNLYVRQHYCGTGFSNESISSYDGRKWNETAIYALEASIAGRASKVQMRQVVFGTEVQEMTQNEQLNVLQRLYTIKRQRDLKKKKGKGKTVNKTIGVRF